MSVVGQNAWAEHARARSQFWAVRKKEKGKKRSSEADDHDKQRLATLKRLKRGGHSYSSVTAYIL